MGTSNSYGGPGSDKPLLPPWADEPIQPFQPTGDPKPERDESQPEDQTKPPYDQSDPFVSQDIQPEPIIRPSQPLRTARLSISRYVNSGGVGYLGRGIRAHTKSLGGASGATRAASSGRSATQKLGGYLSNISSQGISDASEDLGISNVLGKPVSDAIGQIIEKLAPDSATLEDIIARRAICNTLEELYIKYGVEDQGLEALNAIDDAAIEEAIIMSAINFVFERFLLDLADRIENKDVSESDAISIERQMKEYIKVQVEIKAYDGKDFKGINWFENSGREATERIYLQVYEILEVI